MCPFEGATKGTDLLAALLNAVLCWYCSTSDQIGPFNPVYLPWLFQLILPDGEHQAQPPAAPGRKAAGHKPPGMGWEQHGERAWCCAAGSAGSQACERWVPGSCCTVTGRLSCQAAEKLTLLLCNWVVCISFVLLALGRIQSRRLCNDRGRACLSVGQDMQGYLGRAERRGEHPCSELLLIANYILSPPWPCLPALADSERLVSHCQALLTCLRRRAAGKAVLAAAGDEQFLPSLSFSQLLTSKNGF